MTDSDNDNPRGGKPRPRKPRSDAPGEKRPFRRDQAGGDARPPRRFDGDKPRFSKPRDGDARPPRDGGDRPFRARRDDTTSGDARPPRRFDSDKPRFSKPRDGDARPPRDGGDRPFKPRAAEKQNWFEGNRSPRTEDRGTAPQRPARGGKPPAGTPGIGEEGERIARVIARAGLCSRRDAEAWIEAGRVAVNGVVITSPALDVGARDRVTVDGAPLPERERTRLWLYHKPRGLVTTAADPEGRPTVFDNLPPDVPRVVSIGRLDINTEGLMLLTNDGGLARVLAHPETGWLRRYRCRVHGHTDQAQLDALREGTSIDGIDYGPIVATLEREVGDNAWITIDLREGKNREIKRVLEHLGLQVTRLIRVSFGPFQLEDIGAGAAEEVRTRTLRDQLGPRLIDESDAWLEGPRRDPVSATSLTPERTPRRYERRKPIEKRDQALLGEAPDLQVKREKIADRRGRDVKVERIIRKPDEPFEAPREERPSFRKPRENGERPRYQRDDRPRRDWQGEGRPRPDRGGDDRPARGERNRSGERPRFDRDNRAGEGEGRTPFRQSRDGRPERGERPQSGERPFRPRPQREDEGGRERGSGDRPYRTRPSGERPFGDGEGAKRPYRDRASENRPPRPSYGANTRPRRPRDEGDGAPARFRRDDARPARDGDRPERPYRPRPPRDGDAPARPRFSREGADTRPPRSDQGPGRSRDFGDKPRFSDKPRYADKPRYSDKSGSSRPRDLGAGKPGEDRPKREFRPRSEERPRGQDRPRGEDRPRGDERPRGDFKPRGGAGPRGGAPRGNKPGGPRKPRDRG